MNRREQLEYWERVGRHIRPASFYGWFLGVNVPIVLALSVFTTWRNELVGPPTPLELLLRVAVGFAALGTGLFVFWWKVVKPAVEKEKEQAQDEQATADISMSQGEEEGS